MSEENKTTEVLIVHKRQAPKRVRYWVITFFIIGVLGILTTYYAGNYNKTFDPLIYTDAMASNGVKQQILMDDQGYSAIRQVEGEEYQQCEYQLKEVEIVAIQQALFNVEDSFIKEVEAPELEVGMYRVFYKGKAVIVYGEGTEAEQNLLDSLYGPVRANCVTNN